MDMSFNNSAMSPPGGTPAAPRAPRKSMFRADDIFASLLKPANLSDSEANILTMVKHGGPGGIADRYFYQVRAGLREALTNQHLVGARRLCGCLRPCNCPRNIVITREGLRALERYEPSKADAS